MAVLVSAFFSVVGDQANRWTNHPIAKKAEGTAMIDITESWSRSAACSIMVTLRQRSSKLGRSSLVLFVWLVLRFALALMLPVVNPNMRSNP